MKNSLKEYMKGKIVGVIGSTTPDLPYKSHMGFIAGFTIQQLIGIENTLLTGGVEGVGVDVFSGYIGTQQRGNFITLIPDNYVLPKEYGREHEPPELIPYDIPFEYKELSKSTSTLFKEIRAGNTMKERRQILAGICDVIVMLHGSYGTMQEAVLATQNEVPVIALYESGGAARHLANVSENKFIVHNLTKEERREITYIQSNLRKEYFHSASSNDEMLTILQKFI